MSPRRRVIAAACAALLIAIAATFAAVRGTVLDQKGRSSSPIPVATRLALPPPGLVKPLAPDAAIQENSERPITARPDSPAAPFHIAGDPSARARALECLSQAVYYEAAGEGLEGEQAVAQVVLNRVKNPLFPASVCGVVYQGWQRPLGCQFTFACDGSLLRGAPPLLWQQAERVASEALDGKVFGPIGHATHYHADYVVPYWASSLDKSIQIGRHIFYRLRGALGERRAFLQPYAGHEPFPAPVAPAVVAEEDPLAGDAEPQAPIPFDSSVPKKGNLLADISAGVVIADAGAAPAAAKAAEKPAAKAEKCDSAAASPQLHPLKANDLRAAKSNDCTD